MGTIRRPGRIAVQGRSTVPHLDRAGRPPKDEPMSIEADRVADAPSDNWVYRALPVRFWGYAQLARWDRPIGWWLLLWPCWWSLALATNTAVHGPVWTPVGGGPKGDAASTLVLLPIPLFLFWLGAVAMRGAGCTYNDIIDARIDAQVERTASRPIPAGRVSKGEAKVFMFAQVAVGFLVLVALCLLRPPFNAFALLLAVGSLAIVAAYPFAKRVTDWPQLVLGLAFSWGALMGWAVVFGELSEAAFMLYLGAIAWTVGYDTIYAHQDKEDDALVGVRSTARLFAERTKEALVVFYAIALGLFALAAAVSGGSWPSFLGLLAGGLHMTWQISSLDIDDGAQCLRLFRSNTTFGWLAFAGFAFDVVV